MSANAPERPRRRAVTTSRTASPPQRTRPRPSDRRALAVGIALSIGLHVLVVLLSRSVLFDGGAPSAPAAGQDPLPPSGMRAVELSILDDPVTPPEERPEEPELELPVPPRPMDIEDPEALPLPPGPGEPEARRDAIERLQPRAGDPRLWSRLDRIRPGVEPNKVDQLRARVYGRLQVLNDSLIALSEAERRSKDWSYVTEDGQRWGISSEGIHLGSITLPAPNFAPPPGRREEIDRLVQSWHELARQAEMAGIREDFNARVREIRERRDAERRERAANGRDP